MFARRPGHRIPISGSGSLCCAALLAFGAAGVAVQPAVAAETPVMRAGELAGPLAVRGGSKLGTVAGLSLGRGDWTVFAKGVLRNTTRDATPHPVRCRLVVGGSGDQVFASPVRRDRGGSRQVFLLTHAAHLDISATATLECGAPRSATGDVVAEDIRMVAFKTSALGIKHESGSEIFYGNADAISQVRVLIGNDALVPGDVRTVATLALPAGRWAITAKASLDQPEPADLGALRCSVEAGTDYGVTFGIVAGEGQPGDRVPIMMEMVHSDGSSFEVRFDCQDLSGRGTTHIRDIRLVAYRARAIASQVLDPEASYGAFPAWIKPVVYAGHDLDLREIPPDAGYLTINRMTLPGGDWVVVATGTMAQSVVGRPDVSCRVGQGIDRDKVDLRLGPIETVGEGQPFSIVWTGSFDGQRAVRFECRASSSDVGIYYFTMLAYKAGTLEATSLE
jgi:hypothetical protein